MYVSTVLSFLKGPLNDSVFTWDWSSASCLLFVSLGKWKLVQIKASNVNYCSVLPKVNCSYIHPTSHAFDADAGGKGVGE